MRSIVVALETAHLGARFEEGHLGGHLVEVTSDILADESATLLMEFPACPPLGTYLTDGYRQNGMPINEGKCVAGQCPVSRLIGS
jgi:hypothetical protein